MDRNYKNHLASLAVGILLGAVFLSNYLSTPEEPVIQNHSGLTSTLLAMSSAQSPDEIYGILGGPEHEEFMEYTDRFKSIILRDFAQILLSTIYLLQILGFAFRNQDRPQLVYSLSLFGILAGVCDGLQNFQLQSILDATSAEKMEDPMRWLSFAFSSKWLFTFLLAGYLGGKLWLNEKGLILRFTSLMLFTSFSFYLASNLRPNLIELGILFLVLGYLGFWLYSVLVIALSKKT